MDTKLIGFFALALAVLFHGGIYQTISAPGQNSDIPAFVVNRWTGDIKFCNGYNCYPEKWQGIQP